MDSDFMRNYRTSDELTVLCRRFISPEYNSVRFTDPSDPKKMPVKDLFLLLGLGDEKLREVYEFENGAYNGRFTVNGKQNLANLLQKQITFYQQLSSETIIDPKTAETFRSQN